MTSAPIRDPLADHLITPQNAALLLIDFPDAAVQRYQPLLGIPPAHELSIPERDLAVTVFAGLSVISGPADALASVRDLRATAFVDSLADTRAQLAESGWTTEGSLGAGKSLLARDPDGMLAEFVEIPGGTA